MAIYIIYQHLPFKGPPKFTQIWDFGFENKPSGNPDWVQDSTSITPSRRPLLKSILRNASYQGEVIADGGKSYKSIFSQASESTT
jgi:hypothetical protein